MAAADGLVSNPMPGTLSKAAASADPFALYGVGVTFSPGIGPSSRIFDRTSSVSGAAA